MTRLRSIKHALCAISLAASVAAPATRASGLGVTVSVGPHASETDEWLALTPYASPTANNLSGEVRFDACGLADDVTAELELFASPNRYVRLLTETLPCSAGLKVPLQDARYRLRLTRRGEASAFFEQDVEYRSIWIAVLGDSYSSGEGAPERVQDVLPSGLPIGELSSADRRHLLRVWLSDEDTARSPANTEELVAVASKMRGSKKAFPYLRAQWRRGVVGGHDDDDHDCHRSARAWGYRAALSLQEETGLPVDVTLHACSGATIGDGDVSPVSSGEGPPLGDEYRGTVTQQLQDLARQVAARGRAPDLILMTGGGNDVGFSKLVADCYADYSSWGEFSACDFTRQGTIAHWRSAEDCVRSYEDFFQLPPSTDNESFCQSSFTYPTSEILIVQTRELIDRQARRYASLFRSLAGLGVPANRVFVSLYPAGDGSSTSWAAMISAGSIEAAREEVAIPLNAMIADTVRGLGGTIIDARKVTDGHDYGSDSPWIHDLGTSYLRQGDYWGTFHPTDEAHREWAEIAVQKILEVYPKLIALQAPARPPPSTRSLQIVTDGGAGPPTPGLRTTRAFQFKLADDVPPTEDADIRYEVIVDGVAFGLNQTIPVRKPLQKTFVSFRKYRRAHMQPWLNNRLPPEILISEEGFHLTFVNPDQLHQMVEIQLVDVHTQVPTFTFNLKKAFENDDVVPGGGYVENVLVRATLRDPQSAAEAALAEEFKTLLASTPLSVGRQCGERVEGVIDFGSDAYPVPVSAQEETALELLPVPGSGGKIFERPLVEKGDGCWFGDFRAPESILLRPSISIDGRTLIASQRVHVALADEEALWTSATDVQLGRYIASPEPNLAWIPETIPPSRRCSDDVYDIQRGSAFDLNQVPYDIRHEWVTRELLDIYRDLIVEPQPVVCRDENETWTNQGLDRLDEANPGAYLEVWSRPTPPWTPFGNVGHYLTDVRLEIDGLRMPESHHAPNSTGTPSTGRLIFRGEEAIWPTKFRGQTALSDTEHVVTVYVALNALAQWADDPDPKKRDQAYAYGLAKVMTFVIDRRQ